MSLDVYLETPNPQPSHGPRIYLRENGSMTTLTRPEWDARFPEVEPVTFDEDETNEVFSANITHNLGKMAGLAGIYTHLWRPDEIGVVHANQLIEVLEAGLARLRGDPETFKAANPENGWGDYDGLVQFVENYLTACKAYPDTTVRVWR